MGATEIFSSDGLVEASEGLLVSGPLLIMQSPIAMVPKRPCHEVRASQNFIKPSIPGVGIAIGCVVMRHKVRKVLGRETLKEAFPSNEILGMNSLTKKVRPVGVVFEGLLLAPRIEAADEGAVEI